MGVTILGIIAGIFLCMPLVDGVSIDASTLLHLVGMTWLIMITFGTVTLAAGFATGRRAVASALSIFVIIGSFILSTFGQAVDWLSDFEKFSLLHYFPAVDIAKGTIEMSNIVVLSAVTILFLVVVIVLFRRRDIA
jgi:ABC-2 type transport system permease protein